MDPSNNVRFGVISGHVRCKKRHVRFTPIADMCSASIDVRAPKRTLRRSFDHLVGALVEDERYVEHG